MLKWLSTQIARSYLILFINIVIVIVLFLSSISFSHSYFRYSSFNFCGACANAQPYSFLLISIRYYHYQRHSQLLDALNHHISSLLMNFLSSGHIQTTIDLPIFM